MFSIKPEISICYLYRLSYTISHTLTHTTEMNLFSLGKENMPLEWWRKPEYPEETPRAGGDPATMQNPHTKTHTHYRQFRDKFIQFRGRKHVFRVREETVISWGNPRAWGEHANSTHILHRGWRNESNPQTQRCEADMLTTKPPCFPMSEQLRVKALLMGPAVVA